MKNRLKELRQLHQRSQSDLARDLGISRQAVNGFESGKFDPSLDMAFKIASLFDVPLEHIFIYEAKNKMPTLVERFTNFLGFNFGFERFTETAIRSIEFANSAAMQLGNSQVEPEHILIGLLADSGTTSARLLASSGMTLAPESQGLTAKSRQKARMSPHSKFIMELALQIVRLQGKKAIDTEHILWGLVRLAETNKTNLKVLFQKYQLDISILNEQLTRVV